jgi:hypothetical protein
MSGRRPWHHQAIREHGLTLGRDLIRAGLPLPARAEPAPEPIQPQDTEPDAGGWQRPAEDVTNDG